MRRARVICTIGPATSSEKMISRLIKGGMDVARLNFSHGTHEEHGSYIHKIREQSKKLDMPVAVLQDLQGIKIRIGEILNDSLRLKKGDRVRLMPGTKHSNKKTIFISYPALTKDLFKGHRVLFDDGLIELKVEASKKEYLEAVVKEGGILTPHKGVNLPDSKISLTPFTKKDKSDLDFGISIGVDAVALSFVLGPQDIKKVKKWLKQKDSTIPVIAKIEKPEALQHIDAILNEADGIMVARGDLGVEMPSEEIPLIQKSLIRKANERRKIVITATQMLDSMKDHVRPTRAEITDVANAVIDGTDTLMLSAETSSGKYPVESVKMMERIIKATEDGAEIRQTPQYDFGGSASREELSAYAVADSAVRAADDINPRGIVAFTRCGMTALLVSKCRPTVPVIALTPDEKVMRQMSFFWGVTPLHMRPLKSTEEMVLEVDKILAARHLARQGDMVIIIASSPLNTTGKTNFMKIHRVGR